MSNKIWDELKNKRIQVQMPDKTYWQVNCLDLFQKMQYHDLPDDYPDEQVIGREFTQLDEYLKDGNAALQRWSGLLEWDEVKDVAYEAGIVEPDHTLGWRLGKKEVFNKEDTGDSRWYK